MTAPVLAFFNNKGGVGTTSLVYHMAWMMASKGIGVVVGDLDPQANLTASFLDEGTLEEILYPDIPSADQHRTIYGSLQPLIEGTGDVTDPALIELNERLAVLPGDLALSGFEDELSSQWPDCLDGKPRAFRVISAFWRLLTRAAANRAADVVLVDVGPNLGAINRAALVSADHVVVPLAADLFSVQGMENLGPTLTRWRREWNERILKNSTSDLPLPNGSMRPRGYVILGHGVRLGQPVAAYDRWVARIPQVYRRAVLKVDESAPSVDDDPYCLAQLKHVRSLMPMAQEARKPIFDLKPADGAFGGHQQAVLAARADYSALADRLLHELGIDTP